MFAIKYEPILTPHKIVEYKIFSHLHDPLLRLDRDLERDLNRLPNALGSRRRDLERDLEVLLCLRRSLRDLHNRNRTISTMTSRRKTFTRRLIITFTMESFNWLTLTLNVNSMTSNWTSSCGSQACSSAPTTSLSR